MFKNFKIVSFFLITFLVLQKPLFAQNILEVVYPNIKERGDDNYGYQLLKLALESSGVKYSLSISERQIVQQRSKSEIFEKNISIIDLGAGQTEKYLEPIMFPIDWGLSGYRLLTINADSDSKFNSVKTLEDLKKLKGVQGFGWSDTAILKSADLDILTTSSISDLFKFISNHNGDYFPLGVEEIYSLVDTFNKTMSNLKVEESLVLYYPFGRYFYVNSNDKKLKQTIEKGLIVAYNNGSLKKMLFENENVKKSLEKANLKSRKLIKINHNFLSEKYLENIQKYKYDPF